MKNNGMNSHLRRTFYLFVAGFTMLVGVLAYWQVYARESLETDPANRLQSRRVQEVPRGLILAGDGETELARSEWNGDSYERYYPEGPTYAHITGYWSPNYGASGVEISQNNNLSGAGEPETLDQLINQVQGGAEAGNNVELTLDPELQRLAHDQLANSTSGRGSIVAMDPQNGEVLAMSSYPSYDPNEVDENFEDLAEAEDAPLLNRATQGLFPPGSTFKVITAAAALQSGVEPTDEFEDTGTYETPGYTVYNYRARDYGEVDFSGALGYSVNTIFARVAYENVGPERLYQTAQDFGFGYAYEDFALPVAPSDLGPPTDQWVQGLIAQISFGQGPVVSNAFQMAQVTAAIANEGSAMEPRLVREVRSPDGVVIDQPAPRVRENVLDSDTASDLSTMMEEAISEHELDAVIPGIKVSGKTGTAEASVNGREELHSWFITFAPADDPKIAVAVLVENGQEGFKSALPVARRLMETYLRSQGELPEEQPQPAQQPQQQQTQQQGGSTTPQQQPQQQQQLPFPNPFQAQPNQKAQPGQGQQGQPKQGQPGG